MRILIAAALAAFSLVAPVRADQILGPGRIDTSGQVVLPGGPTLGTYQGGKFTATPDKLALPDADESVLGSNEVRISRPDKRLIFKNADGSVGYGSLLNALPSGRKAVEQGDGSDLILGSGGPTIANAVTSKVPLTGGTMSGQLTLPGALIQDSRTTGNSTALTTVLNESYTPGPGNFSIANAMIMNRTNGTGNREALHVEMNSAGAATGSMTVGATTIGRVSTGSGIAFGLNPVCIVLSGASSESQCTGTEVDTDAQRDVIAKVGLQVVDTSGSLGKGTVIDTGLMVAAQQNALGYGRGLQFGYDPTNSANYENSFPIRAGGDLITALPTGRVLRAGIDFVNINTPFTDAAIRFAAGNRIQFGVGGVGGQIQSSTGSGGGSLIFGSGSAVFDWGGGGQHAFLTNGYRTTGSITELTSRTPASSSAPCTAGEHAWDANYEYRCVGANVWKRAALSAF